MKRRRAVILSVLVVGGAAAIVASRPRSADRPPDPRGAGHSVFRVLSEAEKDVVPPPLARPWGQDRGKWVDKVEALHRATEERVLAALGEPNQTWEYPVDKAGDEFRIELWNTYPPGDARSRGVQILEWQWRYKEFSFAVWFHRVDGRWVVLNTLRWRKGIEF
ncbi:MAG: hypothetical protein K2X82_15985 [Gemmataceae bacterium]|nr:hypothetical protein [Gemmataceae bacterium]